MRIDSFVFGVRTNKTWRRRQWTPLYVRQLAHWLVGGEWWYEAVESPHPFGRGRADVPAEKQRKWLEWQQTRESAGAGCRGGQRRRNHEGKRDERKQRGRRAMRQMWIMQADGLT